MRLGRAPETSTNRLSVGEAAAKGALAGLAGGLALVASSELTARGLMPGVDEAPRRRGPAIRRGARRAVRGGSRAAGVKLSGDQREVAAIALELVAAAAIGAAFGVIGSRVRMPAAASGPLLGGLVYASTLGGMVPASGLLASRSNLTWRDALRPAGPQALFGLVTARTFELLADR